MSGIPVSGGMPPEEGAVFTHRREFTTEDVLEFGEITGDDQAIHTEPDDAGRLIVQGLLSGSLMTKIGADLSYTARTMEYDFRRPVYTGEEITCTWTVESVTARDDRFDLANSVEYRNPRDEVVIEASTTGLIWK